MSLTFTSSVAEDIVVIASVLPDLEFNARLATAIITTRETTIPILILIFLEFLTIFCSE